MSDFASLSTFVYTVMVLRATLGQNATNFRFPCGPQDCADATCWSDTREWPTLNYPISEPFFPNSTQGEYKEAICDHLHAATLVVRRNRDVPSVSFERTWQDYENGFGVSGNHWLGLKHVHRLSSRGKQMISLIYRTQKTSESHMLDGAWDSFTVDSAVNHYKLSLGPSRKSIDVMQSAKGQTFYNPDKIKTSGTTRCASRFSGGWWFGNCSGRKSDLINLNGQFNATDADKSVFVGTHVVISAEIRMQPFQYKRDKYTCDKTCPNGGTCQLASDKASYFCRCLPTFTGWRCESQVFSSASSASTTSSITTMSKAHPLVKPPSPGRNTQHGPPSEVSGKVIYIGVVLSTTICLLTFIVASQVAVWHWKTYRDEQDHSSDSDENEIPLLLDNNSKRRGKRKYKRNKQNILSEQSTRNDVSVAESVVTSRSHWEDTPMGKLAKAIRPQKKDKPTGEPVKATRLPREDIPTGESVKLTRSHRDDLESVKTTHTHEKEKPMGESVKATRSHREDISTGESVKLTRSHRDDLESVKTTHTHKKEKPMGESVKATRSHREDISTGESMSHARPQTKDTDSRKKRDTSAAKNEKPPKHKKHKSKKNEGLE